MRRIMIFTVATLALVAATVAQAKTPRSASAGSSSYGSSGSASETPHATAASENGSAPLNNVVRLAADGTRTALCCCGSEFTVTDQTPTMDHNGTTFFMCSAGCKEASASATPQATAKTMAAWKAKFAKENLATNAVTEKGVTTAICGCGKSFTVSAKTPVVTENGVKMYCCSPACHDKVAGMSTGDRMAMESKIAGAVAPAQAGM